MLGRDATSLYTVFDSLFVILHSKLQQYSSVDHNTSIDQAPFDHTMPCEQETGFTEKDIPDLTGYVTLVTGGN
jgi:hypothetical protein